MSLTSHHPHITSPSHHVTPHIMSPLTSCHPSHHVTPHIMSPLTSCHPSHHVTPHIMSPLTSCHPSHHVTLTSPLTSPLTLSPHSLCLRGENFDRADLMPVNYSPYLCFRQRCVCACLLLFHTGAPYYTLLLVSSEKCLLTA